MPHKCSSPHKSTYLIIRNAKTIDIFVSTDMKKWELFRRVDENALYLDGPPKVRSKNARGVMVDRINLVSFAYLRSLPMDMTCDR